MSKFEIGYLTESGFEDETSIEKRALIVYEGEFLSEDGIVKVTAEDIHRLVNNHNTYMSRLAAVHSADDIISFSPPIQLNHSDDVNLTVGRVLGELMVADYNGKVAAYATRLRFLGKENVEKVKDKRWSRLSVGADFKKGTLGELSVVSFSAAPDARVLAAKNKVTVYHDVEMRAEPKQGEIKMSEGKQLPMAKLMAAHGKEMKAHLSAMTAYCGAGQKHLDAMDGDGDSDKHVKSLDEHMKHLSKMEESLSPFKEKLGAHCLAMKQHAHLKAYLKSAMGMDDEQAEEHVGKISEEEKSRLMESFPKDDMVTQDEAALPKETAEQVKMKGFKEKFTNLSSGFNQQADVVKLAAKKSQIVVKLAALRAEGKITPAEQKKIDITKLAAQNDATTKAVFDSYEIRQPVLMVGVYGTKKAEDIAVLTKLKRQQDIDEETLSNMPSTKKMREASGKQAPTKLSGVDAESKPVTLNGEPPVQQSIEDAHKHLSALYAAGKGDEAHSYLKAMMSGKAGEEASAPMKEEMEQMSSAMVSLQAQFDELTKLVATEL